MQVLCAVSIYSLIGSRIIENRPKTMLSTHQNGGSKQGISWSRLIKKQLKLLRWQLLKVPPAVDNPRSDEEKLP